MIKFLWLKVFYKYFNYMLEKSFQAIFSHTLQYATLEVTCCLAFSIIYSSCMGKNILYSISMIKCLQNTKIYLK